MTLNGEVVLV